MTRLTTTVLLMSLAACGGSGARRPVVSATQAASTGQAAAAADRLRGTWELVGLDAQGQPRRASGSLSLDEFQNFAIHVELDPAEPGVTAPRTVLLDFTAKASVAGGDELAYVGLERRAPQDRMMVSATEPSAWRHFSLDGDTLRLWQADADGRPIGTLTFRRAP